MHILLELDGEAHDLWLVRTERKVSIEADGVTMDAMVEPRGPAWEVRIGGRVHRVEVLSATEALVDGARVEFRVPSFAPGGAPGKHQDSAGGAAKVKPPMPGRIAAVRVKEGDPVRKGQTRFVLEAMKMQNDVPSPVEGRVAKVHAREGQVVDPGQVMVEVE
jgi:biotin carboxyl carrier protein